MNSQRVNPTFVPPSRQFFIQNGIPVNFPQKYCEVGHDFTLYPRDKCESCIRLCLAQPMMRRRAPNLQLRNRQPEPVVEKSPRRNVITISRNNCNVNGHGSQSSNPTTTSSPSTSSSRHSSHRENNSVSISNKTYFPHLPFFRVQRDIFGPQFLVSGKSNNEFNSMTTDLKIPSAYFDSIKSGTHDVQLRIFHEKADGKPTIAYPSYFEILLDDQMIGLNGKINSFVAKKAVLTEPIMLRDRIKTVQNKTHRLTCRWKHHAANEYKISVVIVRVLTVDDLYNDVLNKPRLDYDQTRKIVLKMFGGDDDLRMDIVRESLTCPCDTRRITTAARSTSCNHLKCFDLRNFIMLNQKRPIWKCPVCNQEATYSSLIIDTYFTDVLNQMKNNPINEIEFLKNGKWKPYVPKSDNTILLEDSDGDENGDNNLVILDDSLERTSSPSPKNMAIIRKAQEVNSYADPRLQNGRIDNFLRKKDDQPSTSRAQPRVPEVITLSDSSDEEEITHFPNNLSSISSIESLPKHSLNFPSTSRLSSMIMPNSLSLKISLDSNKDAPTVEQYERMISSICADSKSPSTSPVTTEIINKQVIDEPIIDKPTEKIIDKPTEKISVESIPEISTIDNSLNSSIEFSLPAATITKRGSNRRKDQNIRVESPPLKIRCIESYDENGDMTVTQSDESTSKPKPKQRRKRVVQPRSEEVRVTRSSSRKAQAKQ